MPVSSSSDREEWLTFTDLKYSLLPLDAKICFTVYRPVRPRTATIAGSCVLDLFGKYNTLRKGKVKAYLWPGIPPDPSNGDDCKTPRYNPALSPDIQELNHIDRVFCFIFYA
jgi:phosphatidylinositol 3-kinase